MSDLGSHVLGEQSATIGERLMTQRPRCGSVRVLAIDGGAGAGKSSLASAVAARLSATGVSVATVSTDQLLDGWQGQFDFWDRLRTDVLEPIAAGHPGRYRSYDWVAGRFCGQVEVPVPQVLIVEGVSAIAACGPAAALTVFVDVDRGERERRWVGRDGEPQAEWFRWLDAEDRYFASAPSADLRVRDGVLSDPPAVRRVGGRTVYRNPWMQVNEDDVVFGDGSTGIYGVVSRPDFVLVLPAQDDGFWLVEQYRYPVRSRQWEFPQGGWAAGRSGSVRQLAATELAEETGHTAGRLDHLGRLFAAYGYSDQRFDVFLATDLSAGEPDREATEQDMQHRWFSRAQVWAMVADGRLCDSHSLAALTLLQAANGARS